MFQLKQRLKASGYHLLLSAIIATIVAGVVLLVWYPWPYSEVCGGLSLLFLVASVDIVLGPLLTFVVFDRRKPTSELVRDLFIVGMMQITGLTYGAYTVFVARPVALVFEGARFKVITNVDVVQEELPKALPELRVLSITGPRLLGTRSSKDENEKFDAIARAMAGWDIGSRPIFWQPYTQSIEQVLRVAKPLASLYGKYPESGKLINAEVKKTGREIEQLRFLPLISKNASWVVLLDAKTAEPVGFIAKEGYF